MNYKMSAEEYVEFLECKISENSCSENQYKIYFEESNDQKDYLRMAKYRDIVNILKEVLEKTVDENCDIEEPINWEYCACCDSMVKSENMSRTPYIDKKGKKWNLCLKCIKGVVR